MAFGKVTKLDPVVKKPTVQKTSNECTEEELIDSSKYHILIQCTNSHKDTKKYNCFFSVYI